MKRRQFLKTTGSLALLPLLPWSKQTITQPWMPPQYKDIHDYHGFIVAAHIGFSLEQYHAPIQVFYDVCSWRSMIHNWIGWCERIPQEHLNSQNSFTCSCNYPIKYVHPHIQTKRVPVMGNFPCDIVDYPQNEYWDELKDYGHRVAIIAQKHLKR